MDRNVRRAIEFFVRDNISRVVDEVYRDETTIETVRRWLETEGAGRVVREKKQRITQLALDLGLDDETTLADIRVDRDPAETVPGR